MKNFYLLAVCLMCIVGVHAQERDSYRPFIEEGKVWTVLSFAMGGKYMHEPKRTDYYFDGEAIVAGRAYTRLVQLSEDETALEALVREEGRRVYICDESRGTERVAYDFNLSVGDETEVGDIPFRVTAVGMRQFGRQQLRTVTLSPVRPDGGVREELEWIEGIGCTGTPLGDSDGQTYVNSYNDILAYQTSADGETFLPCSFSQPYNGWWGAPIFGDIAPVGSRENLEYEFTDPDIDSQCYTLHVRGTMYVPSGKNAYLFCVRDDESAGTFSLRADGVPLSYTDDVQLRQVDVSFPYFMWGRTYVFIDANGEHEVKAPVYDGISEVADDGTPALQKSLSPSMYGQSYDLNGRRAARGQHGVFIHDGRKTMVR